MTEDGGVPPPQSVRDPPAGEYIDPVWTVYFDGRSFEMSRAVAGYPIEDWLQGGKEFFRRVFTPESYERMRAATRQVRETGRPLHNVEVAVRDARRDTLHHFLVNYRPLLDAAGAVVALRGDARNITDLRGARLLGEDATLMLNIVQNTQDFIWVFYVDGRPGYANRALAGHPAKVWAQSGVEFLLDLLVPDSRRRLERALSYLRASGESARLIELELEARANRVAQRLVGSLSPVFDPAGAVHGALATLHDITDLTLTRAALRRSESSFRDLIDNAHDLVWIVDREGRWVYLNQATRQFYGLEPESLIGKPFTEVTHPDHQERERQVFAQVLAGHSVTQYETVHLHGDGSPRYLSFNIQPRMDVNWETIGAMGMARDITQQKLYQRQLEHLADHDVLTGLYNRNFFEQELERTLALAVRSGAQGGLLYIDIDNFKYVNDTLGHSAGDELLIEVAQMLHGRLRQGDVLARFGGDEFTLLLHNVTPERLQPVAQSFQTLFNGFTFLRAGQVFDVRVSIGATMLGAAPLSAGEALSQADLACTLAKTRGRNQAQVYRESDQALATMVSEVSWTRKINEALEQERFELFFQPVVRTGDGRITHHEVLLRMREPDGSLIAPGLFLPAAERFGLMHQIDRWVTEQAVNVLVDHQHREGLAFAINLSARVLDDDGFLPFLRGLIEQRLHDPTRLTFEITETTAIAHMASAREFIDKLKLLGCRVALDDFGSGFSSYGYLKHLQVDYLKIDGSFIQHLAREPIDQAIVQSMNQVAHALGKQTIAEFVEDEASLELLRSYGVDYVQGYHLGKPSSSLTLQAG